MRHLQAHGFARAFVGPSAVGRTHRTQLVTLPAYPPVDWPGAGSPAHLWLQPAVWQGRTLSVLSPS